ncbi:MAG: AbiH family protein [Selenomonadaceae bacterium]
MNILVIGNGFDLAHDLPTTYEDFLCFLEVLVYIIDLGGASRRRYKGTLEMSDIKDEQLKESLSVFFGDERRKHHIFENLFCNICENDSEDGFCAKASHCEWLHKAPENDVLVKNKWIDYLLLIYKEKKFRGEHWIDVEFEIQKVMKFIDEMETVNVKDGTRHLIYEALDIKEVMDVSKNYQASLEEKRKYVGRLEIDLNRFNQCLEQYMLFVNKIEIVSVLPDIKRLNVDKVLSFNYTNTYERYYGGNRQTEYNYIHGRAGQNNIILGFNEYLKDDEKDKKLLCVRFKKFFQRIYKGTGCSYKSWIVKGEENNVFILGHSLDVTDKDVMSEIIMNEDVQRTTIFYHNKESQAKQIMNLIRIIGQDNLIRKTYDENPQIVFKQQDYPKKCRSKTIV